MNEVLPKVVSCYSSCPKVFRTGTVPFSTNVMLILGAGASFGYLFERSHVYEPSAIREQFIFRKWTMMKMFMGAVAGACTAYFFWLCFDKQAFQIARQRNILGGNRR